MNKKKILLKEFGICNYKIILKKMHKFTKGRKNDTLDEIWLLEHYSVFTQGRNGKKEHLLNPGIIPIIQSDRGGQVTYHGPGQQIMYILIDLKRNNINIRTLINALENTVINTLSELNIHSYAKKNAPGVYIKNKKICSMGLRIQKNCSIHGLALNINMNLKPFLYINPCGHPGMQMTQISNFISNINTKNIKQALTKHFCNLLNFELIQ